MADISRDEALAKIAWEELEIESLESCELVERHVGLIRSALLEAYSAGRNAGYDEGFEAGGDHAKLMLEREAEEDAAAMAEELADKIGRRIKARFGQGAQPINMASVAAGLADAERERRLAPHSRDVARFMALEEAGNIAADYAGELASVGNNSAADAAFALEEIYRAKARG
jgi:hypothetical protein